MGSKVQQRYHGTAEQAASCEEDAAHLFYLPHRQNIDWANNYFERNATKSEAALSELLDNVAKQTSLEFTR